MRTSSQAETLELVALVQEQLITAIRSTTEDPHAPSRLEGWTLGHVLTHIARHADSVVRRLEGAARGEAVEQYTGGMEARIAAINAGAQRTWAELVADVVSSADLLMAAAEAMPEHAWSVESPAVNGMLQPASVVLRRRLREVALHHTDLGLGYEPTDWPTELVDELRES
jgi:maleylpyruvate isomerase